MFYAQKTPDPGRVSSVAYLAEKVSIDWSIVEVLCEAAETVGNYCLLHQNYKSCLAAVRVPDRDSLA